MENTYRSKLQCYVLNKENLPKKYIIWIAKNLQKR